MGKKKHAHKRGLFRSCLMLNSAFETIVDIEIRAENHIETKPYVIMGG